MNQEPLVTVACQHVLITLTTKSHAPSSSYIKTVINEHLYKMT
jgi:hypothetical protein